MSQQAALPASIVLYDQEEHHRSDELALDYIDAVAAETAGILARGEAAEIMLQPGDGTAYGIVIVPLRILNRVQPRIAESGLVCNSAAMGGMLSSSRVHQLGAKHGIEGLNELPYIEDGYLVSFVDSRYTSYPIRLGKGRGRDLVADYVDKSWAMQSVESSITIAVLLRAISYYLAELGL